MADDRTVPKPGNPEAHWASQDPQAQPSRDEVIGLKRMVTEARTRLGPSATPAAIVEELHSRGADADPEEVARCCAEPYRSPGS